MKDLSDNSIDCFICDLPYGCLTNQKGKSTGFERPCWKDKPDLKRINRTGDSVAWDIAINLEAFWTQVKRLAKDEHTPVLMFCTTKFGYDLIKTNEKWFRYDLVWDKGRGVSFLHANKMPMRSHEMIYVFSKSSAHYERVDISGDFPEVRAWGKVKTANVYNLKSETTISKAGRRCVLSVIKQSNFGKKDQHPTEKPLALYEWLIQRYCPKGGTILDPTAGSFNSCEAALNLGRNAIGIEKESKFFEKARKRFTPAINEIIDG